MAGQVKHSHCNRWLNLMSLLWWWKFFVAPPHDTLREKRWSWKEFFVGISKSKFIAEINMKKQDKQLSIQYTSVKWLRYNKIKNVVQCHTFIANFRTNPFCGIITTSLSHHVDIIPSLCSLHHYILFILFNSPFLACWKWNGIILLQKLAVPKSM